jgi:hypothetical protein
MKAGHLLVTGNTLIAYSSLSELLFLNSISMQQHNFVAEVHNKHILDTDLCFLALCFTEVQEINPKVLTSASDVDE